MKTFRNFIVEQEGLNDFLGQHGLEDDWKEFRNRPKPIDAPPEHPKGWSAGGDEPLRNLNRIIKETIDTIPKVNNFGIDSMQFEKINEEKTSTGTLLNMEASGTTSARNKDHIKKQLAELLNHAKEKLSKENISLQILYNKLDISEAMEETSMDEPAIGLVRKWSFRVICAAVCK